MPIQLAIDNFSLEDVEIKQKEDGFRLENLHLSMKTEGNTVKLLSLTVNSDLVQGSASGSLDLTANMPLHLNADWTVDAAQNGRWIGTSAIIGNKKRLNVDTRRSSPFKFDLNGHVDDILNLPKMALNGRWEALRWPLAPQTPQIESPSGNLEISGFFSDYTLKLDAGLNQAYLKHAGMNFLAQGGLTDLNVKQLALKSDSGTFNLNGRLSWKASPTFDFKASADRFNPAVVLPQLPGDITLDSRVSGTLAPGNLQIDASIDKLAGQLRRQSLDGRGRFRIVRQRIDVDAFAIMLGSNKLQANGVLGPSASDFKFSIDMPKLDGFWPGFAGRIQGNGNLQGNYANPVVQADLKARQVQFSDLRLKQADIHADYFPENAKPSVLSISANGIDNKTLKIDTIDIDGHGTPDHHEFNVKIVSPRSSLSADLLGDLQPNGWLGTLKSFAIVDPSRQRWTLQTPWLINAVKKTPGFDISLDRNCLVQASASLCLNSAYFANGDLNFGLDLNGFPIDSLQAFFPPELKVHTQINAHADIRRQKKILQGTYKFGTTPVELVRRDSGKTQVIKLGVSDLSGIIEGDRIAADFKVNLTENDKLTGNLETNTGRAQTLSGRLIATLSDFSMFQTFIPQIEDLKGNLNADLNVHGTFGEPIIGGRLDLNEGSLTAGDPDKTRIGLRQIEMHAVASGERALKVDLIASAVPVIVNPPKSPQQIDLKSLIRLNASLNQTKTVTGNFTLNVPPGNFITVTDKDGEHKIAFGQTSIKGLLSNDRLEADLDMALTGHDFVRGKLNAETGAAQSLDGWVKASVSDFATFEKLVPQVSNLKGSIATDLAIGGTAQAPLLNGKVSLTEGEADINDFGLALRAVNLSAETPPGNNRLLQLKGSARSGEGSVDLSGKIELDPLSHYPVEARLNGENFEVVKLPEAQIAVSPDLSLTLIDEKKLLAGQIAIPKAALQIEEIPENAVAVSDDEIILGEEPPETVAMQAPGIDTAIEIKLGKDVKFKGLGLQTELKGNLNILKTTDKLIAQGNVDMEKGSYKRFGQNLTLRKGRFLFNGPVDNPWLDVEATRLSKDQKVTAILALTGNLKNPQTHISSDPALPEADALAYLVTGSPLNQVGKSENNMLASAALSYGAGKASWLTEKLGISEFDVVEGSTLKDTLLVMGQYLTPDFYVGTKIGMFNKQANLVLKHKLTDAINVETQTGTSQRIKLNYEFDRD